MIEVVSSIYHHGLRALDADELLEASKAFAEIERPLTEAEQLSRRAGCTLATLARFDELRSSVAQHAYLAQARLAIRKGDGFIQRALDSEELDMELVWSGLDAYQDACVLARGHAVDIETEAIGVARRGRIYAKVLRSESPLAPSSFKRARWRRRCCRARSTASAGTTSACGSFKRIKTPAPKPMPAPMSAGGRSTSSRRSRLGRSCVMSSRRSRTSRSTGTRMRFLSTYMPGTSPGASSFSRTRQ